MLNHCDAHDPQWMHDLTRDELEFQNALQVLLSHGMVETAVDVGVESQGYSIHTCVHSWISTVLNLHYDEVLATSALQRVASHVPCRDLETSTLVQGRLISHANRCLLFLYQHCDSQADISSYYHRLGSLYLEQGKLAEAEKMYQQALQGKEKAWGPDYTLTLDTINNLGLLYAEQGKIEEAEEMYQRALQGYKKAWGLDYILTLNTVNNLGLLYAEQGKMDEAEKMYQQALRGYEKAYGPDYTSSLNTVNNLSILYKDQGKMVEVEEMYQQALQGKEKAWGPNHISTLNTVNNLGLLYAEQGKMEEAEEMYQRALQGYEKACGPDHTPSLVL